MKTQRFNAPLEWYEDDVNVNILGLFELILALPRNKNQRMIEIGSYMGESTMLFASSQIFKEIHAIEPFAGHEDFNEKYNHNWYRVKKEFEKNTRFFDNIIHHEAYSYNIVDEFNDDYDFIYIDGSHDYKDIKRDLELYLPKLKKGGIIGGHDYHEWGWPGVFKAVNEVVGKPDTICCDTSWIKKV
tara:strand:- start:2272 stop:2829 length:558 start_codon:yes stop_codon:yes gene_type:complete